MTKPGLQVQIPKTLFDWPKKEYVKAINNKLIFTKNNCFAIDSLKVCQEAYEDLLANLIDVNKVIEQAEKIQL